MGYEFEVRGYAPLSSRLSEKRTEMSKYLDDIIDKQYGATNVMVVFLDIIKYSLRKSVMQQKVINALNAVLQQTFNDISKEYAPDAQKQELNFLNDIIKIPTGDGAAIVFPFQGMENIHLNFTSASCVSSYPIVKMLNASSFRKMDGAIAMISLMLE